MEMNYIIIVSKGMQNFGNYNCVGHCEGEAACSGRQTIHEKAYKRICKF
jgi:hypothetical protein